MTTKNRTHVYTVDPTRTYYTVNEMERMNSSAGFHWFSPDTMRFFKCLVGSDAIRVGDRYLFVSSERGPHQARRLYTIREFFPDSGQVETAGEFDFQGFKSLSQAMKTIRNMGKPTKGKETNCANA